MIQSFEDLLVYKRSYKAALDIYSITKKLPEDERYGMTSQLKRASTSIPLNIAEGYGKKSSEMEFKRFLIMAKGSCDEMRVLIDFCNDLEYITEQEHAIYKKEYMEIGKMLSGIIEKWKNFKQS